MFINNKVYKSLLSLNDGACNLPRHGDKLPNVMLSAG
jgi:hypothetical protein